MQHFCGIDYTYLLLPAGELAADRLGELPWPGASGDALRLLLLEPLESLEPLLPGIANIRVS